MSAPNANLHKAQQERQEKWKKKSERESEQRGEQFVVARAMHTRTYIDTDTDTVGEIQLCRWEMLGWSYIQTYVYRNRTYRYNRYLCCGG